MCESSGFDAVVLHQDTFAADHQQSEIALLGWAIKFAGMCGKEVRVIPNNQL